MYVIDTIDSYGYQIKIMSMIKRRERRSWGLNIDLGSPRMSLLGYDAD
jgi:hypothetical protein